MPCYELSIRGLDAHKLLTVNQEEAELRVSVWLLADVTLETANTSINMELDEESKHSKLPDKSLSCFLKLFRIPGRITFSSAALCPNSLWGQCSFQ
jgi:hypothetical protein